MSVKTEYGELVFRAITLREKLAEVEERLEELNKRLKEYTQKTEELSRCSSELAKTAINTLNQELRSTNKEIYKRKVEIVELSSELESVQSNIQKLSNNPSKPEAEQAERMAQELKAYVDSHEMEFGREVSTKLAICQRVFGNIYVPDGSIIISLLGKTTLVSSDPFYIGQPLYIRKASGFGNTFIQITEWFETFFKYFLKVLRSKIEEVFRNDPNFSITFTDDQHFNIELL